jgi:hypothetical protein
MACEHLKRARRIHGPFFLPQNFGLSLEIKEHVQQMNPERRVKFADHHPDSFPSISSLAATYYCGLGFED